MNRRRSASTRLLHPAWYSGLFSLCSLKCLDGFNYPEKIWQTRSYDLYSLGIQWQHVCAYHSIFSERSCSRARSRIKFVIHFMYIDCTYNLVKKFKTTHRKLMSSWAIRMTLLLGIQYQSFKKFTWFWIFLLHILWDPDKSDRKSPPSHSHTSCIITPLTCVGNMGYEKTGLVHVRHIYSELK
jgi:hypothetical protein